MKKFLTAYVDKDALKEDGIIPLAVASDASVDRDGDIVDPAGLDTAQYERNPVLLYAHDYRSDPIGKTLQIKKDGSRVLFTPQLAIDISPRAKMYFQMIKEGVLNAFSIGFIVKEWAMRDNGAGEQVRVFTKTELLEISLVPVPANANALVLAREYVGKMEGEEKTIGEAIVKDMELEQEELSRAKSVSELLTGIEASVKTLGEAVQEATKVAGEASTAAKEVKEGLEKIAQERVAINGEDGGEKALTVKEVLRSPEFGLAVLRAVDKAVGVGLRDGKRS